MSIFFSPEYRLPEQEQLHWSWHSQVWQHRARPYVWWGHQHLSACLHHHRPSQTRWELGLGRYSPYRYRGQPIRIDTVILSYRYTNMVTAAKMKQLFRKESSCFFLKQNLWTVIITYLFNEKSCKNWVLKHLELCSSKMTA